MSTKHTPVGRLVVLTMIILAAASLAAPASARTKPSDDRATLERYAGVYILPSGARFVVEVRRGIVMVRPGSSIDAWASDRAPSTLGRLDDRAAAVVYGLAQGETTALRMALASPVRKSGEADISHLFDTFARAHGTLDRITVLGTVSQGAHRAATLVYLSYTKGSEVVRLHWYDGALTTVQRGAHAWTTPVRPAAQVAFRQVRRARSQADEVTFNLRSDGRVESMTIAGRHGSATAYRLDAAPAASLAHAQR